ncbi:hypothetical protein DW877_03030 [[Clostridium] symbiosum]|nr:hypothetical protein DW877_03030 [[Clostridium] symbiosum]
MGRALSRPLRVSGKLKSNLPQLYKNAHLRHIVTPVNGSTEWPRQGPPPHLTRETISGRRPADGGGGGGYESFVPGEDCCGLVLRAKIKSADAVEIHR